MGALDEMGTVGWALGAYRSRILPAARRELRGWAGRAATIPDRELRDVAAASLRLKRRNPEATAVFGLLAPRRRRGTVLRAGVALQVAVDYLDALTERPDTDLATSLRMHGTLTRAVAAGATDGEQDHPSDGGYLEALLGACRQGFASLPAAATVAPIAQAAALRCGEGQGYTHAGGKVLSAWAEQLEAPSGYPWWEVAAGASSSVAVHALIAAAADSATRPDDALALDAAYFPPIGALTVLLDDLVDFEEDRASGQHNYLAYYPDADAAADRVGLIAGRALGALDGLRRRRLHGAILAGVAGFYLAAPAARSAFAAPVRERLREAVGPSVLPVLLAMRLLGDG